jgi:adenosylcobinamide-GDP ribazoletransferase
VRALLSFFTTLPVGDVSLEAAAKRAQLLPLVGLFTAAPGVVLILLGYAMPPGVVATLALGAVLLAAGLHHTDGVLDTGDALMVRGTHERRRAVLKDTRVGIGGIGALFFVYAPTLAALAALADASPARAALALLAGEVSVRSAMLLILAFGKPAEAGSSSVPFSRALKGPRRVVGVSLALLGPLVCLVPLGAFAPLAALSAPLTALIALQIARRAFGGIAGDVAGATGELARGTLLVLLSTLV